MNRLLFVGLCLVGMFVFVISSVDTTQKEQPKTEITKDSTKPQ